MLYLREIEKSDLRNINRWRNDKEIVDLLGANYLYIAETIDEKWYDNYIKTRDKAVRLAIITTDKKKHIGNVNLTNIHPVNRSAEFSIFIGDKNYWSKGFGSKALFEMLKHGFQNLNLQRIFLFVLKENKTAYRMYKKTGFLDEGLLRGAVYKNSKYKDVIIMSILRQDYFKKYSD